MRDRFSKTRRLAALLLQDVLDEKLSPAFALARWPETDDLPDVSLDCAYQALWHLEADEDQQRQEVYYLDAQLALLAQMAVFLKQGRALPAYFLKAYPSEHRVRFFYPHSVWTDTRIRFVRRFMAIGRIWKEAFSVLPWLGRNASGHPRA